MLVCHRASAPDGVRALAYAGATHTLKLTLNFTLQVWVLLKGHKEFEGILLGLDSFLNLVLSDVTEYTISEEGTRSARPGSILLNGEQDSPPAKFPPGLPFCIRRVGQINKALAFYAGSSVAVIVPGERPADAGDPYARCSRSNSSALAVRPQSIVNWSADWE